MRHAHTKQHRRHRHSRPKPAPGARSPAPGATGSEPEARPATPQEACARAQEIIVRHWPGIIQAVADKALEGSHQHAKYLSEFAGFSGALGATAPHEDESLAALLLKRLEVGPDDDSSPADTTPLL